MTEEIQATPEDIEEHAQMLMSLAQLVRGGMLSATRVPGADFRFKITDAGERYVKAIGADAPAGAQ
jgi:hypothetical protein